MAGFKTNKSSRSHFGRSTISEINVTPFVDVMLVLLVVFMITAPLITQGVQVALPEVENAALTENEEPIQLTVKKNGVYYIQSKKVEPKDLVPRLLAIKKVRHDAAILLRADKDVPYGKVMEVMGALQSAGLVDVGMVTQPQGAQ